MCGVENFPNPVQVAAGAPNPYSCPAGFVRQRTGTIAESVQVNKEQVDNHFCAVYTCVRCSGVPDRSSSITDAAYVAPISVPNASVNTAISQAEADQQSTSTSMQNNFNFFTGFP